MRKTGVITFAAALAAAGISVAGAGAGGSAPTLQLAGTQPLKLHGTHFRRGEKVRVKVRYGGLTRNRVTRTTQSGTFTVAVATTLPFDPCTDSLVASAVGAGGDSARLKMPQRACPPSP